MGEERLSGKDKATNKDIVMPSDVSSTQPDMGSACTA